jgi:hypothetical protein
MGWKNGVQRNDDGTTLKKNSASVDERLTRMPLSLSIVFCHHMCMIYDDVCK